MVLSNQLKLLDIHLLLQHLLKDEYKLKNPTALENLFSDTAARVLVDAQNQLMDKLIILLKSTIDGYDYEVDEKNTQNHFYGIEV